MGENFSESAVWQRVTAASRTSGGSQEDTGPVGPELLSVLERERETAQGYRALAMGASGEAQRTLLGLWRQSQQQRRTLSALYFFLTGERPILNQGQTKPPQREELVLGLRRMMQREELSAGRLEALSARTTGEAEKTLRTLALGTRRRFDILLGLLGGMV